MGLLEQIKDAGVIGAGGAGFPTYGKLGGAAEYILLNGAECEPLLRVDQQLMAMYPEEIILGFSEAGKLVGAKKAIIGIKNKHKKVIQILEEGIAKLGLSDFVEIKAMKDMYPAGDEQVLVYELTGRVVPEAGIPIQVGCVVINSETALNIYKAAKGEAVTEKYITVAGDIPRRVTVKVPVGTPIIDVLALSGIENFEDYGIIDGGPMMGPLKEGTDGYITKKNKGFILLKKDHFLIRKKSVTPQQAGRVNKSTCEQCRMCTDLCPRYLLGHNMEPHKMMRILNYGLADNQGKTIAQLCCQCNLCEYFSCPAGLFPRSANALLKEEMLSENIRYQKTTEVFEPRKQRSNRLLPSKRLVARLALTDFDKPAPMVDDQLVPNKVRIMTSQHVGAPAIPCVSVNQGVTQGQLIGTISEGALGANIHAGISGIVSEVNEKYIEIRRG